jgi:hypothetical protein
MEFLRTTGVLGFNADRRRTTLQTNSPAYSTTTLPAVGLFDLWDSQLGHTPVTTEFLLSGCNTPPPRCREQRISPIFLSRLVNAG